MAVHCWMELFYLGINGFLFGPWKVMAAGGFEAEPDDEDPGGTTLSTWEGLRQFSRTFGSRNVPFCLSQLYTNSFVWVLPTFPNNSENAPSQSLLPRGHSINECPLVHTSLSCTQCR